MNAGSATANEAPRPDWLRPLRYLVRTPLLLVHLGLSLPLTLVVILGPGSHAMLASGERVDHRAIRWWSAVLLSIFGIRCRRLGAAIEGGALLVSNHRSWLDIELIHSQQQACFVAKSEIERWPLVGWLASQAGTIYHRRGSTESLSGVSQTMVERLRQGLKVAVFPEGGIRPGNRVHTFHARIFQAAIEAGVPVQPVALRVTRRGLPCDALCERPGEGFLGCFLRVLGEAGTEAEVVFLDALLPDGGGRRRLAEASRQRIMAALGQAEEAPRRGGAAPEPASDDLDPLAEDGDERR